MQSDFRRRSLVVLFCATCALAWAAWRESGDGFRASKRSCPSPVEVRGRVARPAIVCGVSTVKDAVAAAGGTLGCDLDDDGPVSAGDAVVVGLGEGDRCAHRRGAMSGPLRRALGLPIDLNVAEAADLRALPGLGEKLAARVVAARRALGPFDRVEALRRVRGLGPKRIARIAPHATVGARGPRVPRAPQQRRAPLARQAQDARERPP